MEKVKLIITGSFKAAIDDLPKHINEFRRSTMYGVDRDGPFKIVHVDSYHMMKGMLLRGYQVHTSAYGHKELDKAMQSAQAMVR